MNRTWKALICATLGLLLATPAIAQEGTEGMPSMGPPAELQELAAMQGEWIAEVQYRETPDAPWTTAPATATIVSEMGGCILRTYFKTNMMGSELTGEEMLTYNRETKQYESVWIDSMTTHLVQTAGTFEKGKLVMTGDDMMMGQPYKMRNTTIHSSENQMDWIMEMSMDGGKTWFESMKATYTRKSS